MKVSAIMTKEVVSVDLDDSLEHLVQIFERNSFHHILVTENGYLSGIVSDRDLLKSVSPFAGSNTETTRDAATLQKRTHQIMTRKPLTLAPDATVTDAVQLISDYNVSCIPIVSESNRPLGVLTWRDIFKVLAQSARRNAVTREKEA